MYQAACDVCLAEHEPPAANRLRQPQSFARLSKDAQGTVEEARRLHAAIGRKSAMIKSTGNRRRHRSA